MCRSAVVLSLVLAAAAAFAAPKEKPVSAAEMADAKKWVQQHLAARSILPFSFTIDRQSSFVELPKWKAQRSTRKLSGGRTRIELTYTQPGPGLVVRCVAIQYADYPTVEWTVYLKNAGTADTPILADIRALDAPLHPVASGEPTLHHWTGSPCAPNDYQPHEAPLTAGTPVRITTNGGRPTNSDMPYFNVDWHDAGVIAVLGWPGQWAAMFAREADGSVRAMGGQELTHLRLHPGEEIRTPLAVLQFWRGDWVHAQNVWRRWMLAHNLPRYKGKLFPTRLMMCTSDFYPGMQSTAEGEIGYIDAYVNGGVKLDYWDIDAGWYPCDGPGWPKTGTWEADPKRYPHGLKEVGDRLHRSGIGFEVWFEPERVHAGTWLAENHPEWILGGKGGGLLNLGNPEAWKWVVERVDKMVREEGIDLYRQDFNMDPLEYWRSNDAPDRQGMTEIRHVEGYLAYWDELRRRHPDMPIDTCASGGRRNDLETLRRSLPLLRSDYRFEPHGTQGHTYGISFSMPYYGTGVPDSSDYVVRSHWCPWLGIGREKPREPGLDWTTYRRYVAEWRKACEYMLGDYYPLTPYSLDANAWMGWQFDRPERGDGMVQAFRRVDCPEETITLRLRGLDPDATYTVTDLDEGSPRHVTGSELMAGLTVAAPQKPAAVVVYYVKAR